MGPEVVVREAPLLAEDLRLEQRVEALTLEALVPELALKRLDGAILPGAAGSMKSVCTPTRSSQ